MTEIKLEISNKLEELHRVNATLEQLEEDWELPMPVVMNLNLCIEEALTNVIFYAFDEKEEQKIKLNFRKDNGAVSILMEDKGKAFNPLEETKTPDVEAKAEDREIGGLGVFFIKQFMDEVSYNRVDNTNQLIMTKQL